MFFGVFGVADQESAIFFENFLTLGGLACENFDFFSKNSKNLGVFRTRVLE